MSKTKALGFVKQIQQSVNKYADEFNKEIPDVQNYSAEYIKDQQIKNKTNLRQEIAKKIDSIKNDIKLFNKEIETKKNEILFPLLSKPYAESSNLRGEQQITNAMLMFQINYLNGNPDFVIGQINQVIVDPDRRDYVSTLLNQIVNFPVKDERFQKPFDEAMKIKTEFENQKGITEINETKKVTLYAEKMSDVTMNLVKKDYGGFDIPDYQDNFDFSDKMNLATLSNYSGVDLGEFSAAPGDGNSVE